MKVAVWDTYVTKMDGKVMHFDIIVPENIKDTSKVIGYGNDYLKSKGQDKLSITSKECTLCHFETARPEWESEFEQKGYCIIEMENCE
jgi:hypothetical protein